MELIGQKFDRWTIAGRPFNAKLTTSAAKKKCVVARCECGTVRVSHLWDIVRGRSRSCGCIAQEWNKKRLTKHGHHPFDAESPTYASWRGMRERCQNSNHTAFPDYGGRGITVCGRWLGENGFSNFLADMGERPDGKTLDRFPNMNGNYEPGNCRWATRIEQAANRRNRKEFDVDGVSMTIAEWARACGISERVLWKRLRKGRSMKDAIAMGLPRKRNNTPSPAGGAPGVMV